MIVPLPFLSSLRTPDLLKVGDREIPLVLVRNPRSRRYFLRLRPDGTARVTIPRGGTIAFGKEFARANQAWLEKQLAKPAPVQKQWRVGDTILFRGESVVITVDATVDTSAGSTTGLVHVGSERVRVADVGGDLRPAISKHFWRIAHKELAPRVLELAALHGLTVGRVTIRNQKSRWGSCSGRGTISLNWRLIQAPAFVSDYIILHELMHRKQMNHSPRFWREVERVCPEFRTAEEWVKRNGSLLR